MGILLPGAFCLLYIKQVRARAPRSCCRCGDTRVAGGWRRTPCSGFDLHTARAVSLLRGSEVVPAKLRLLIRRVGAYARKLRRPHAENEIERERERVCIVVVARGAIIHISDFRTWPITAARVYIPAVTSIDLCRERARRNSTLPQI